MKMKKRIVKVTALILAVLMTGAVLGGCNSGNAETSSTASTEEIQLKDKYEYVELDENKVYFADIDIKDCGKIIV